ncbi:hypothetical protein RJ640_011512 [Escallonia rubra]|uniref:Uncharacterized protein n=1 Tax=Escallonia rubra TaxID=112253 RepID=A0AA88UL65_9ASTE|nr:hypothetical protein RJ640_011512 [Escallonia rubra]
MQSAELERVGSAVRAADTRGKHRVTAELKRLEQEARFLEYVLSLTKHTLLSILNFIFFLTQEELEQLEKMEAASAACKE